MPYAPRHARAAERAGTPVLDNTQEYEILDPSHQPDSKGELGGAKVYVRGGKQLVRMTPDHAKFYLDSGSLAPLLDS